MFKNQLKWMVCGISAAIVLSGCGSKDSGYVANTIKEPEKAEVKSGEEKDLFPLAVGNQWTYTLEKQVAASTNQGGSEAYDITLKVVKVDQTANGTQALMEILRDEKVTDRQTWVVNDKGIYQLTASINDGKTGPKDIPMTPMQPALLFPAKAGSTFEWKGKGAAMVGKVGDMTSKSRVLDAQNVDSDMGKRFSTIPVETKGSFTVPGQKGEFASTVWFTPKVGMVRIIQSVQFVAGTDAKNQALVRGTYIMRLKAYVVK